MWHGCVSFLLQGDLTAGLCPDRDECADQQNSQKEKKNPGLDGKPPVSRG
ncbi:MAG: hypothetical protein P8X49_04135 [Syntrophobacterales bacterium]